MTIDERLLTTAFGHAQSARNDINCIINLFAEGPEECRRKASAAYLAAEELVQMIRDKVDENTIRNKADNEV